jgi:hypothetical protein
MEESNFKHFNSVIDLKLFVEIFLSDNLIEISVKISSNLRKPIREFKTLYPTLFYFAYGLGKEYVLVLSKKKLTIEFLSLTPKCKKIFIENIGLRIIPNINKETIHKINTALGLDKWFEILSDALLFVGGEKEFVSKHFDLSKKIWTDIKKSPMYNKWKNISIEPILCPYKQYPTKIVHLETIDCFDKINAGIYNTLNNGAYFLSIDLKAANFQALKINGLVCSNTWQEYMEKFITHPYFGKLKKFRLKILSFADLYPDKQKIFWQNIILSILDALIKNNTMLAENFAVFNSDEIIFHTTKKDMKNDKLKCETFINELFPKYHTSVEIFQLHTILPNKPYFVKINQETKKIDWKCIDVNCLPEVITLWHKNNNN